MSHIVTITFSPCIDKSTTIPALYPEKKLRCSYPKLEPGGGGINVARAIKKLGEEAVAIFPSGGYTGKYFDQMMKEENISSVIIPATLETRENIIVLDESSNNQYRFGMPGNELSENEWKGCLEALKNTRDVKFIVASGSLPPGVPIDVYAQLAKIAREKKAKLIVDTSGEALRQAVEEGIYLLKPNLGELSALSGKGKVEINDAEHAARELVKNHSCEIVVVSLGKDGAMLVTAKETFRAIPPKVIVKSTVGAGDSMVAGIVYSLFRGKSLEETLQYGVAAGTAATLHSGTELCRKSDTDKLFELIRKKE